MSATTSPPLTALVLAASRKGIEDSVAKMQDKTHKCLVEIDGEVMLERVVRALDETGDFSRIFISIDSEQALRSTPCLTRWLDEGKIAFVQSQDTLADSLYAAAHSIPDAFPLVVTTGDNALHTTELVADFNTQFREGSADLAVSFTDQKTVDAEIAESGLAYHQLKDGGWSACNLYGLRTKKALKGVEIFRGGGQFGKKHWRILKAFGVMPFLLYKLHAATLHELMSRIAKSIGLSADAIVLNYAYGPIDVDNPKSFQLSEDILKARRTGTS